MKRLTAIILFVIISFNSLVSIGVVSHYYLNKKYYAEVLCINKANKASCCEGKCQLKKELASLKTNTEKSEVPLSVSLKFESLTYLFFKENPVLFISFQKDSLMSFYPEKPCISRNASPVFKPPIV